MKDSTASTYTRMLRKLCQAYGDKGKDMTMTLGLIPACFLNALDILKEIELSDWKDSTKKNNMSLMLTMLRCFLGDDKYLDSETYQTYRSAFDKLKASNYAKQEQQKPTETEAGLEGIHFDRLPTYLNTHMNKIRSGTSKDLKSALLNMLGHLHCDQVLRNECAGMMLTKNYLDKDDYPKTNFIWNKGRNVKMLVIRDNKVRNADLGNEPKEVWLKGKVNTAINKYIQVLSNTLNVALMDVVPLVTSKNFTNSLTSGDGSENISSSHYSQVFKGIWEHKGFNLTTTQVRKLYAMDVRDKFKGNLLKEKEACIKLDHSESTHNLHYILDFS